jgi:hypothetical protein
MSSEEKAPDIKIEWIMSAICMLCIIFLIMAGLHSSSYQSSVSAVLALGLSAVALAIVLLAIQVRYPAEQK